MKNLIFWEMNEINFDFLKFYISIGKLPSWKRFVDQFGIVETVSESEYDHLEPWIQWPTVRTGLDFKEHKVFRLGDIEDSGVKQHWEIIEDANYSVAAFSPINGSNKTKKSKCWIPDPWVDTRVSGGAFEKNISKALRQAVNENASGRLTLRSIAVILYALIRTMQVQSLFFYLSVMVGVTRRQRWSKALILDRLLADMFIWEWKRNKPDFATLFSNCGAHIQHHYMCSSPAYKGSVKNPEWYVPDGKDPLLEILELYDDILADLLKLPNSRLMIAVGMRQVPHEEPIFYWRLRDHESFMSKIGVRYKSVNPRMTRDFLVVCESSEQALTNEAILKSLKCKDRSPIFGIVDNRGESLFVTLTYGQDIPQGFTVYDREANSYDLSKEVDFVAIKNGKHDSLGYVLDTEMSLTNLKQPVPLKNLFGVVVAHFGLV